MNFPTIDRISVFAAGSARNISNFCFVGMADFPAGDCAVRIGNAVAKNQPVVALRQPCQPSAQNALAMRQAVPNDRNFLEDQE